MAAVGVEAWVRRIAQVAELAPIVECKPDVTKIDCTE